MMIMCPASCGRYFIVSDEDPDSALTDVVHPPDRRPSHWYSSFTHLGIELIDEPDDTAEGVGEADHSKCSLGEGS